MMSKKPTKTEFAKALNKVKQNKSDNPDLYKEKARRKVINAFQNLHNVIHELENAFFDYQAEIDCDKVPLLTVTEAQRTFKDKYFKEPIEAKSEIKVGKIKRKKV